ncbi:aldehyde ferredoxin oxidoreductase family protein [Sedimentibacter sp. MB31-C6]|uniref:aldehyde ferredoxin oxidoreductase family protein n=1 Tax=Sedimentibacter sp. MB31-C6 TaxID=3109366 RepID=UPI002DDCD22B|nr:aldehyde ferredoxin oxidoreductase C-terminal domain-containing protein [Sedimentibacter sp. MB36-C1]WSI04899.1 aldehyde ferredoxin oxidoreductase C-terminal domain-containing protein [Sedimentibacter sp. MB36-C1]
MDIDKLKEGRKLLKEYKYDVKKVDKGYTYRTLYVNVSDNKIESKEIPQEVKDKFIGGKGFGLWYLWKATTSATKWNDPENEIIISGGPACGITQYPGSGKSLVCSISPMTDIPIDSNVGGYFGPLLKFSGWDALEIQGKADKDIIVFIDGDKGIVRIEEAPLEAIDSHVIGEQLTEMYAESEADKRNISVVSAGTGSEHTKMGVLNFSFYDLRRKVARFKQAGRGGLGTIFRDKKIKALIVKYSNVKGDSNNPVDRSIINKAGIKMHKEVSNLDDTQNQMRKIGTAYSVEIMSEYDLLPVMNYQYGGHQDANKIGPNTFINCYLTQGLEDGCWYGCSMACAKTADNFELKTGPYKGQKVTVDGPEYETIAGVGSNCGIFDPKAVLEINFYCDTYGIDTISFGTSTAFVMECYERGLINNEITGGLELNFGNSEASLELLHQMSKGEGFGTIVGQGIHRMKKIFAEKYGADSNFLFDIGMEQKGLEYSEYGCKESLAQQGGFGLTNKGPQHDEAWLIFMDMVNNQIPTFEDKAEALYYYPMFRTWFGLYGFCKLPWNDIVPADNKYTSEPAKIPEHVQNYLDVVKGVTGRTIGVNDMIKESERVYNFQKIFNIRMGKGLRVNDKVPYRSMGPVTKEEYESRQERYDNQLKELLNYNTEGKTTEEKMAVLRKHRESQYEKLQDAVYKRRGWNSNAVPKIEHLKELGIDMPELIEVIKDLQ